MDSGFAKPLNPVSFLQAFITQSVKVAEQRCGGQVDALNYIQVPSRWSITGARLVTW